MRYFIRFAYNGKNFHGWQIQPNAPSVQEQINYALSKMLREDINVVGAGRTDTGVHASEMFAHFETDKEFNTKDFVYKLNRFLKEDISIFEMFKVTEQDHTRFSAVSRKYEYHISTVKNPFKSNGAYLFKRPLDLDAMNAAAQIILGQQDFSCFSKSGTQTKTNICDVTLAEWSKQGTELIFTIKADRFLRNMVRAVTGTLLKVGLGEWTSQEVKEIIESKNRSKAGESVPAHGLYLVEVKYPENIEKKFQRTIEIKI